MKTRKIQTFKYKNFLNVKNQYKNPSKNFESQLVLELTI